MSELYAYHVISLLGQTNNLTKSSSKLPGEVRGVLYTENVQKAKLNMKLMSVPCTNEMRPCRVEDKERAIRITIVRAP